MSTLGKVLAVFNVLAAIAFLALAAMDYSKRQNWAYAHYKAEVLIHGLPVDFNDTSWRTPGRTYPDSLTQGVLKDLFGGSPVRTQKEEVENQKNVVLGEVDQADTIPAKRTVFNRYLLPLATDFPERQDLLRSINGLRAGDQKGVDDLRARLEGYFDRAASEVTPESEGSPSVKRSVEERRQSIASLLYTIASPEGRTRVQSVVGLSHYVTAADRHYTQLVEIRHRLQSVMAEEQAAFLRAYEGIRPELQRLADDLQGYQAKLDEQRKLVQQNDVLYKARQAEVKQLQDEIAQAQQKVGAETATLDQLQQRLFALEQQFAQAQAANQRLEQEIRSKESGR